MCLLLEHRSDWVGLPGRFPGRGGECLAIPTDISNQQQVEQLVQRTLDRYERIDILVNNAGTLPAPTPLVEMEEAEWDRVFAVNTKGVYWTVRCVWPVMEKAEAKVLSSTRASVIAFQGRGRDGSLLR